MSYIHEKESEARGEMSQMMSKTSLTAMQGELLKNLIVCLPFVADLSRAEVSLFSWSGDKRHLISLFHASPHTVMREVSMPPAGSSVEPSEYPMVARALSVVRPFPWKGERMPGVPGYEYYTHQVMDSGKAIAAVSLKLSSSDMDLPGSLHLLKTAKMILEHSRKTLAPLMYRPLSPENGVIIADSHGRIIYANETARHVYHALGVSNLLGLLLSDRRLTRYVTRETVSKDMPFEREMEAGSMLILRREIPIRAGGDTLRSVIVTEDVTAVREREREIRVQAAMIQEIHHRVKNNLQLVASLLRMAARRARSKEARDALTGSVTRVSSIAAIHDFLSREGSETLDIKKAASSLMDAVAAASLPPGFRLEKKIDGDELVLLAERGMSLALVINELILNSVSHAFPGRESGLIGVSISVRAAEAVLDIYDDGVGLPPDFSPERARSLGLRIVRTIVGEDLAGSFSIRRGGDLTRARIVIPYGGDES